jgi:hypothetical protein
MIEALAGGVGGELEGIIGGALGGIAPGFSSPVELR